MTRPLIKGSNILVVGGVGFIGSHLVDRLIEEGAEKVIVVDNMFLGRRENLASAISKGCILYVEDAEIASSLDYIFSLHDINIVFNCATKALNYSFMNPSNAFMTNVQVLNNLLELQRKKIFTTLCHFSSSEAYGTAIYEPMDEEHPLNPTTTYAAGKAAADIMLQSYVRMFDVDAFIVRPFNNYGPRQNYEGELMGVIPNTILKILRGDQPIINGSGNQSRDFIFVYDTVNAVLKVFSKMQAGDIVNIAQGEQITIKELVSNICELLNYEGSIHYEKSRISDVNCHIANTSKIRSMIEYKLTNFNLGLKNTIEWYRKILNPQ